MKQRSFFGFVALVCLVASPATQAGYSNVFIFGDSLSDSGNNAIALAPNVTPASDITDNTFIPIFPYASGHYTNDQVWAQIFATSLGLRADPSLQQLVNPSLPPGTDYAFGGARTGPLTSNPLPGGLLSPFPPTLETQAAFFLGQHGNAAPSDALYVVAGGGNNARDALPGVAFNISTHCTNPDPAAFVACATPFMQPTADAFATDISDIVDELETAGARHIVVWDVPDIGKAPAVTAVGASVVGSLLAATMNTALLAGIGADPDVKLFDIFGLVDEVVANKGAFGITFANVTDACVQCDPSDYFFWDGIHPTLNGQKILAEAMLETIPEPGTLCLLSLAFSALAFARGHRLG
jgi:outer membrane lipase/esterase